MPIKQLTEEQVRTWTLEQKDEWWLKNVYRGDMPQLTLRSGLTGAVLGSVLSLTNLYVGIRTGWTLGVGITSVIISFAIFKMFSKLRLGPDMTILENSTMQTIASAAGYMTAPLMASMSGYMLVTGVIPPQWQVYLWTTLLGVLGVLFAFPLKKRAINDEQLPFPEGYAAGVVLDNLYNSDAKEGIKRAKFLGAGALVSATIEFFRSEAVLDKIGAKFLALPHYWDEFIYKFFTPSILGTPMKDLLLRFDTSIVMMGTGMLMSMRTAGSMLLGGLINYGVLAPILIQKGIIAGGGFKNISLWSLWGGAAMMTTASLYSFFSSESTVKSFKSLFSKGVKKAPQKSDILKDIELPFKVSLVGVPIIAVLLMIMGHAFFGIDYWLIAVAIPLVFIFSIMAVKSTGLTAVTPGGAMAKMTQVVYSVLSPGNLGTNLISAGITSEVALNASNLLMDIKPAYMLGGKPRQQAIGHVIGIFAGGIVSIPVFYMIFGGDTSRFGTDALPMPGAMVWKAVAEVLSQGLSSLHPTAQVAVLIGAILGIVLEIIIKKTKGRFPISPVGLGLPFVLPFTDAFLMFMGSFIFWLLERRPEGLRQGLYKDVVDNRETIGAGVIAGGSIVGIILLIIQTAG